MSKPDASWAHVVSRWLGWVRASGSKGRAEGGKKETEETFWISSAKISILNAHDLAAATSHVDVTAQRVTLPAAKSTAT